MQWKLIVAVVALVTIPAIIAAVMMEPNAGTNGIVAPDNYWPALRKHTADRGVWLVAHGGVGAFGRWGGWVARQRRGEGGAAAGHSGAAA